MTAKRLWGCTSRHRDGYRRRLLEDPKEQGLARSSSKVDGDERTQESINSLMIHAFAMSKASLSNGST